LFLLDNVSNSKSAIRDAVNHRETLPNPN